MTIAEDRKISQETISPDQVHEVLKRHILADGLDLVFDLQHSRGAWIHDSRGNRDLLDFFGCFSTIPLGYNHPALTTDEFRERILGAAINKPSNSDIYTVEMAEFVRVFATIVPEPLRHHLFFIAGGALAVENAMKAAFDWKHRKNQAAGRGNELGNRIIHFREAFHGRSGYTLSVTNTDLNKTRYFPKFDWPRVSNPKLRFPITTQVLAEVEVAEAQAIAEIEQALVDRRHDIAGLLIEPIQGEGGDNHFRPEFLRRLRDLALAEEFLLIFDEVQTGFATTGRWWCFEHLGVVPDLFAFGKKSQVCGIAGSSRLDEVDSVFRVPGRINSTWGGNLVDMVRCQRIIETIEDDGILPQVERVGAQILTALDGLEDRYPGRLTNARGRGLFLAFDLPDTETRRRSLQTMREQGLLGLASGTRSIRFRPPLILDAPTADDGLERLTRALDTVLED